MEDYPLNVAGKVAVLRTRPRFGGKAEDCEMMPAARETGRKRERRGEWEREEGEGE
jgi:hypothetical protein